MFALLAAAAAAAPSAAEDLAPLVSPDRIDDVPSTKVDPYPAFDNFAWRAFVALNWPSLARADRRGEPDRTKTLADGGLRVWETFKSRYELFPLGPDRQPMTPSPWASYDGPNPCGPHVDNRAKTLASFVPYADFNQPGFTLGESLNPLVAQNRTYTRYEVRVDKSEYDAIGAKGWSEVEEPSRRGSSGRPADRLDRGQGVVAPDDGCGYARHPVALLHRRAR